MPTDDPCARAERLRAVREDLVTGQAVSETSFNNGNTVRYARADLARLDADIAAAEEACRRAQGGAPRRRRFAMGVRVRPY